METETLDKLFLEWSQFTVARTAREIALTAALATCREALQWYADEKHYTDQDVVDIGVGNQPIPHTDSVSNDGGQRARAALAAPAPVNDCLEPECPSLDGGPCPH
jgi:hypothetical protein